MTVILDPGNAPDSYTDHVSRAWKDTAGLWHSKDTTDLASLATMTTNYNNEVTLYNNEVTLYNNEVTAFNNLQSGLNNPDGLTTVAMSWPDLSTQSGAAGFNFGTFTLTLPRSGHFVVGYSAVGSLNQNGFGDAARFVLGGTAGLSATTNNTGWSNNGTVPINGGYFGHGDFSAGQTITVSLNGDFLPSSGGSASGTIYAHFVPDATHHN